MTTIKKPDGTVTTNLDETLNKILDYILTEEKEIDNLHHQIICNAIEETIYTDDDTDFSREEIKNVTDSFNQKESPRNRWFHRRNLPKNNPTVSQNHHNNI
jgi:hypothetical protein